MKTKIFALLMAVVMLLSLTLIGCSDKAADKGDKKDAGKANDQVATQDANVEIAPEEYVSNAFDKSIADAKDSIQESLKNQRITLSIGDLNQILTLADVDTTEMPPLSDITLDVYASAADHNVITGSVMLGETFCDLSAFFTSNGDIVFSSNLVEDTYSITLEEIIALSGEEATLPFEISEYFKYNNAYMADIYVRYVELIFDLILEHAELTATDNGDTVSATFVITPEDIAAIIAEIVETAKNDTALWDYINFNLVNSGLDTVSADDIEFNADEIINALESVDFSAEINMTVDKDTVFVKSTDIIANVEGEQFTISITSEDENNMDFVMTIGEYGEVTCNVEATDDSCIMNFAVVEEGTTIMAVDLDAKDGVAVLSITTANGGALSITGKYEISDKMFKYMLESISSGGATLDLTPSKIALATEIDVTLPDIPKNAKEILTLTESELSTLAMQLVLNSGILNYVDIY